MNEGAKRPRRVLVRVPIPDRKESQVPLGRQLKALLGELAELGFGQVLAIEPSRERSPSWERPAERSPADGWSEWIAAWSAQPGADRRDARLAELLVARLREETFSSRPLVVVWPIFPEASVSPLATFVHFSFSALVELGDGEKSFADRPFYVAYPRQSAKLRKFFESRPAAASSVAPGGLSVAPPVSKGRVLSAGQRDPDPEKPDEVRAVPDDSPPPVAARRRGRAAPSEVYLGVALPGQAAPGDYFVARFAAYTEAFRREIRRIFRDEAPGADQLLDLERTRWKVGTEVVVQLAIDGATVDPPVQHFSWDDRQRILRFDVRVDPRPPGRRLVLRFDVFIAGVRVLALRPELALADGRLASPGASQELEVTAPKSAFASYAHQDEAEVLGRIRSVEICTGMDVFVDRFGILPGRPWEEVLAAEIARRDLFWLFWSRHAMASQHVEWEWRKALAEKTLKAILPHPLEPADLAPPPPELAAIQFGGAYESYLKGLADRAERPRRG